MKKLEDYVLSIPDFPEEGIIFRDITTVLEDADGFALAVDSYKELLKDVDFDVIVGVESRGFVFGAALANMLHKPLILARKPGKLPRETISQDYELEYGKDSIEMHTDSIKSGQRAVIIDDLIATGGTVEAVAKLVERLGGSVAAIAFMIELAGLNGRKRLEGYDIRSAIVYEGK
ncbi:MAG: adenine phosphoribosyltransferase [Lachnospiraceae bacterium]|nr:adenine phosphoribosyltransferase [Lachnospiraceae bacterium]